ncbi:MAG: ATP-binding cassette domain-containing protein, partial [Stellaceae bacterium]
VRNLHLALPDGTKILAGAHFEAAVGEAVLLSGPTGVGKSTLIRAVAGIWPFGSGEIRLGEGRVMFVPQRPYLPLGTLADALCYPAAGNTVPKERLEKLLADFQLRELAPLLDAVDNWAQRLSLGEQQRLAFARIMLVEPTIVFLDEATSAVDEAREARCYRLLRTAAWHPTIVSVGHRGTLQLFHDRIVDVASFACEGRDFTLPDETDALQSPPLRAAGE